MFRQRFRAGGAAFVVGVAGMLLTAGTSRAQVFNTVAVNTPCGFTFYTFPANYYPSFIPMYPAWYGYPNIGLTPYYYPYGTYATTFDMMPPPRKATPRKVSVAVMSAPSASEKTAAIDIRTPTDARVWIQGKETTQRGALRRFVSPPLNAGQTYLYDVRVSWTRDGKHVTQDRRLQVRAGDRQSVLVLAAPASSQVAGASKLPASR